jgi:hypothetical protein
MKDTKNMTWLEYKHNVLNLSNPPKDMTSITVTTMPNGDFEVAADDDEKVIEEDARSLS